MATKRECMEEMGALAVKTIAKIEEIDKKTPVDGSTVEPQWLLDMQEIRKQLQAFSDKYN